MTWDKVISSEVLDIRDGTHDSPKYKADGYPLITSKNLKFGKIDLNDINLISEEDYKSINRRSKVDKGDILYSMIGSIGNYALIEDSPNFAIKNVALFKFKDDRLFNRYFLHLLNSPIINRQIEKSMLGGTQKFVSLKILRNLTIPLPPIEQQKKIAAILDAADAYRQKTKGLIEKYDALAQSLFLELFGDPATNPKGWDKIKLGQLHKISSGGTPSRKKPEFYQNGKIAWVKTGELKAMYALNPSEYITQEALDNSSAKLFPINTLLIAMYGATIGACSILKFEAATNQACAALLPTEKINVVFEYFYFKLYKQELIKMGVGGAQPNISAGILKNILIYYPPIDLQNQFAEYIKAIENQKNIAKKEYEKSEDLFNSLLQKAFKGELV
ncbi:restriction endonuclease subunit S [Robertkochia marina]|uniref:Restriction endonuclease subunit S n=1 Tax=Robertkochia marina TaxID=1227945 RepID=A0A4S3LZ58_9FLAO|nr:restriction endonuclease subunit S [Robertkochia marina]THD66441.1 restriction endonuclease subunit S [Robertkochia marina]TRZ44118.1 restriction endonuclease subunit S [Robertkochia marina]